MLRLYDYGESGNVYKVRVLLHQLGVAFERGHHALRVMEEHLGAQPFFVGGRYSIADVALYAYTHVADEGGFDLGAYPHLREWLARVAAQPRLVGLGDEVGERVDWP